MSSKSPDYKTGDESSALPPPTAPHGYAGTAQGVPVGYVNVAARTGYSNQPAEWSSGLCDCFSDWTNCCITCWCPCITFGQISEILDRGSSSCPLNGALYTLLMCVLGCPNFYSCFYRTKMRQQYKLTDGPCGDGGCGDCLVHCCCEQCALCQEYRQLQSRGYDMSLGWHANAERIREAGMTGVAAPTVPEGMRR